MCTKLIPFNFSRTQYKYLGICIKRKSVLIPTSSSNRSFTRVLKWEAVGKEVPTRWLRRRHVPRKEAGTRQPAIMPE